VDRQNGQYLYRVEVRLGSIRPEDVQIELYADPLQGEGAFRQRMVLAVVEPGGGGVYEYTGAAPASRPADYYTPRATSRHDNLSVPLETPLIAWQK
jgi:starch phosphorylase